MTYKIIVTIFCLFLLSPTIILLYSCFFITETELLDNMLETLFPTISNTLIICGGISIFATLSGGIAAFFLVKTNFPFRSLLFVLVLLGLALPMHVHISTWLILLGRSGIFTNIAKFIFPGFSIYNVLGVIWINGIAMIPLATLLCSIGFYSVDKVLEEQTSIYLSVSRRIFWVVLPQGSWSIITSFVIIFVLSFGEMSVVDVLGINTIARKIYLLISLYYKPKLAILFMIPILIIITIICLLLYCFLKRKGVNIIGNLKEISCLLVPSNKYLSLTIVLFIISAYIIVIPVLFNHCNNFDTIYNTYRATSSEIWYSLTITGISSAFIAIIAMPLAWIILRKFPFYFLLIIILIWLTLMPGSLLGIGIVRLVNKGADLPVIGPLCLMVRDSNLILFLSLFIKYLPYGIIVCMVGLRSSSKNLEETIALQGCNKIQQFLYAVFLPYKKYFLLTFLVSSIFCLGDLNMSILVIPPGIPTLTIRIFTLLHYGVRSDVACCSIFLIMLIFIEIVVSYLILNSGKFYPYKDG